MIAPLLLALLSVSAPQTASRAVSVGRWQVEPEGSERCHMIAPFGAHRVLSLAQDATGRGTLVVYDDRWKLTAPRSYDARYSWNAWRTTLAANLKSFTASNGLTLLGMRTDTDFTASLAGAKHLWLRVPELGFDGDFDIPETGQLLVALQGCNDQL